MLELNEAFAAVGIVSTKKLGVDPEVVNVNGGAIAMGHPVGMSGARIVLHLAHELKRRGAGSAAALCGGGGQGRRPDRARPHRRSMRTLDPPQAVAQAREGDRLALARLISAVEERADTAAAINAELPPAMPMSWNHRRARVGKSTTTAALIERWRAQGLTVAVLAVDPSSPFTGGAPLGDRVRMGAHSTDSGVFIRSMAARGQLGGLAAAAPAAVRVLTGCGFDIVLVETVGVGQSEVDIVRYADTVVILQAPGMGDRIQATKAGLMEIGDVLAVNKSDRPGANATKRELIAMVSAKPVAAGEWRPRGADHGDDRCGNRRTDRRHRRPPESGGVLRGGRPASAGPWPPRSAAWPWDGWTPGSTRRRPCSIV